VEAEQVYSIPIRNNPGHNLDLNDRQRSAVDTALSRKLSYIHGPPGTGKTHIIAALVYNLVASNPPITEESRGKGVKPALSCHSAPNAFDLLELASSGSEDEDPSDSEADEMNEEEKDWSVDNRRRILCIAQTNTAARHMAESISKLLPPNRVALLVSNEFYQDWHECEYVNLRQDGYKQDKILQSHDVAICTVAMTFASKLRAFLNATTTIVLDESSQVLDCFAVTILARAKNMLRLVLFGDHKQLPPYLGRPTFAGPFSLAGEAKTDDTKLSILSVLQCRQGVGQVMLNEQYRMAPKICKLVSNLFYDGKLRPSPSLTRKFGRGDAESGVFWHETEAQIAIENGSVRNQEHTRVAFELFRLDACVMEEQSREAEDIAVICMYEAQRKSIEKCFKKGGLPHHRIKNVDGFQGI
jgi:hypothetical protein